MTWFAGSLAARSFARSTRQQPRRAKRAQRLANQSLELMRPLPGVGRRPDGRGRSYSEPGFVSSGLGGLYMAIKNSDTTTIIKRTATCGYSPNHSWKGDIIIGVRIANDPRKQRICLSRGLVRLAIRLITQKAAKLNSWNSTGSAGLPMEASLAADILARNVPQQLSCVPANKETSRCKPSTVTRACQPTNGNNC
jgi:hypothetical protein